MKALGFTEYLFDVACMEGTSSFYDFYGFDGIRSTQPTMLNDPKSYRDGMFIEGRWKEQYSPVRVACL